MTKGYVNQIQACTSSQSHHDHISSTPGSSVESVLVHSELKFATRFPSSMSPFQYPFKDGALPTCHRNQGSGFTWSDTDDNLSDKLWESPLELDKGDPNVQLYSAEDARMSGGPQVNHQLSTSDKSAQSCSCSSCSSLGESFQHNSTSLPASSNNHRPHSSNFTCSPSEDDDSSSCSSSNGKKTMLQKVFPSKSFSPLSPTRTSRRTILRNLLPGFSLPKGFSKDKSQWSLSSQESAANLTKATANRRSRGLGRISQSEPSSPNSQGVPPSFRSLTEGQHDSGGAKSVNIKSRMGTHNTYLRRQTFPVVNTVERYSGVRKTWSLPSTSSIAEEDVDLSRLKNGSWREPPSLLEENFNHKVFEAGGFYRRDGSNGREAKSSFHKRQQSAPFPSFEDKELFEAGSDSEEEIPIAQPVTPSFIKKYSRRRSASCEDLSQLSRKSVASAESQLKPFQTERHRGMDLQLPRSDSRESQGGAFGVPCYQLMRRNSSTLSYECSFLSPKSVLKTAASLDSGKGRMKKMVTFSLVDQIQTY